MAARLVSYLRANGGIFEETLRIGPTSSSGRGLFANKKLQAGQLLILVPPQLWLSWSAENALKEATASNPTLVQRLQTLATTILGANQQQLHDNLIKSSCLATLVGLEHQQSNLHPYIEFLEYPGEHPLLLTTDADELLQGSSIYKAISIRRKLFTTVGESLFGQPGKNQFLWGMSVVQSRALSGGPDQMPLTLVPGLDLANHSTTNQNAEHRFDRATATFSLVTTCDVDQDQEVHINYGPGRDTASFMSLYGFFDPAHENDMITLQLSKTTAKQQIRLPQSFLLNLSGSEIMGDTFASMDNLLSPEKEMELRGHASQVVSSVEAALGEKLLSPARAVGRWASAIPNKENEDAAAVRLILASCDTALEQFLPIASDPLHDDNQPLSSKCDGRLQQLLSTAGGASTAWHRHCALASSRELDALLRLRACIAAYGTAISLLRTKKSA